MKPSTMVVLGEDLANKIRQKKRPLLCDLTNKKKISNKRRKKSKKTKKRKQTSPEISDMTMQITSESPMKKLNHYLTIEADCRPCPKYLKLRQTYLTSTSRQNAIYFQRLLHKKSYRACTEAEPMKRVKMSITSLFLAVSIFDRYMSRTLKIYTNSQRKLILAVSAACLWIASKIQDVIPPLPKQFARWITEVTTWSNILELEIEIFQTLEFDVWSSTVPVFVTSFGDFVPFNKDRKDGVVEELTTWLCSLTLDSYEMLSFSSSLIAATCIARALVMTNDMRSRNAFVRGDLFFFSFFEW